MPVPRIVEGALRCGRTQGSSGLAEWFGCSGGGGPKGPARKSARSPIFSGDVMKAPRRPARSPQTASLMEQLESRQLLSVGLGGGVLTVNGSTKSDNIRVTTSGN